MSQQLLYNLTLAELERLMQEWGQPPSVRANSITNFTSSLLLIRP